MYTSNLSDFKRMNDSWKTIIIDDEKFSVRAIERDRSWKIFLTNLRDIWVESLDPKKISQKCQKMNPSLSIEDIDVVQFVGRLLNDIHKNAKKKSIERIEFAEDLEGGIFKFSIDFQRGSSQEFWEEVTMPLCLMAGELQRRQAILLDLVKKKDEEITEYKLNGATLIRSHIETKPFFEDSLKKHAPKLCAESSVNAFENVMKLHENFELFVKVEPASICLAVGNDNSEKLMKIEKEIVPGLKNRSSGIKNEVGEICGATERDEIQESSTVPTNIDKAEVGKSSKKLKNVNRQEEISTIPKNSGKGLSPSAKRLKKTIHDFIT